MKSSLPILLISMIAASIAVAQTQDMSGRVERAQAYDEPDAQSMEAERQRLGNQRIQQEMERRAREEERRLEEERERGEPLQEPAGQPLELPQGNAPAVTESTAPPPQSSRPDGDSGMSEALEQLRTLGELRDAGYISKQEHEELKQKVLDSLN